MPEHEGLALKILGNNWFSTWKTWLAPRSFQFYFLPLTIFGKVTPCKTKGEIAGTKYEIKCCLQPIIKDPAVYFRLWFQAAFCEEGLVCPASFSPVRAQEGKIKEWLSVEAWVSPKWVSPLISSHFANFPRLFWIAASPSEGIRAALLLPWASPARCCIAPTAGSPRDAPGAGLTALDPRLAANPSVFVLEPDPQRGPGAPLALHLQWELLCCSAGTGGGESGPVTWDSPVKQHWRAGENCWGVQGKGRGLRRSLGSENHGNEGVTEEYQLQLKHQESGLGV